MSCYHFRKPHMDQFTWIFWILLGVALIVAETFTLGFVLLWFGIGALIAAAAGAFGVGLLGQFLIFAAVSIALTAASRTIFANFISRHDDNALKMGIDALPGQIGTVTSASVGALNEGAVKVYGSTWTAYPEDDVKLVEGEKVEVVRVQGSSIYVRPVVKHLPDWRGDD
jgi:membrane protein implicated in regulation of membrane protease activity